MGIPLRLAYLLSLLCGLLAAAPAGAVDEVIDSVMYRDPEIPVARVVKVFPPGLSARWLRALDRPENDLKCQAAATIALAHRHGMPGLDSAVGPLLRALDEPAQHPTVRLTVAQALIALDARQAAPSLLRHAQTDGIEMRNLVEPALARWNHVPARVVWLERLTQPGLPGRGWLVAIQALAAVGEPRAVPRLREMVLSPATDPIVRLEAARALGILQTAGLEMDAERLIAEKGTPENPAQLAAASLLRKHRSEEAARVQQRLAVQAEPTAAAVALEGLLEADARRVLPMLPLVLARPDPTVRVHGIEAHRRSPQPEHVALVAGLFDDPHPRVRVRARDALVEVGKRPEHAVAVRRQGTRLLATANWRALEQATILLTLLDHKPAATRFVELLQFDRPEVYVTAAWGLRRLAVPETLPAQLREVGRRWQETHKPEPTPPHNMIDLELAQLAQSLGRARYAPASAQLMQFIPKQLNPGPESRAAAIWALGLIHQDGPPAGLADQLIERMTDQSVLFAEDLRVRRMSAVSLGRMKVQAAVESLRDYAPKQLSREPFPNACAWALEQVTGEAMPTSGTVEVSEGGWFLDRPSDQP
jgi:HEAT repeat protein